MLTIEKWKYQKILNSPRLQTKCNCYRLQKSILITLCIEIASNYDKTWFQRQIKAPHHHNTSNQKLQMWPHLGEIKSLLQQDGKLITVTLLLSIATLISVVINPNFPHASLSLNPSRCPYYSRWPSAFSVAKIWIKCVHQAMTVPINRFEIWQQKASCPWKIQGVSL